MFVTFDVSHLSRGWLKALAPSKVACGGEAATERACDARRRGEMEHGVITGE